MCPKWQELGGLAWAYAARDLPVLAALARHRGRQFSISGDQFEGCGGEDLGRWSWIQVDSGVGKMDEQGLGRKKTFMANTCHSFSPPTAEHGRRGRIVRIHRPPHRTGIGNPWSVAHESVDELGSYQLEGC